MNLERTEQKIMKKASLLTSYYWDKAYSNGDDSLAMELTEETVRPILTYLHAGKERPDFTKINYYLDSYWQELKEDINSSRDKLAFGIGFEWPLLTDYYKNLEESFEPDSFDNIIGIYLSGIPLSALASDYFEGDHLIMRYSHHRRNYREVKVTEGIKYKMELKNSKNLLVDDTVQKGETLRKVGEYLFDGGASEIIACAMLNSQGSNLKCQNVEVSRGKEELKVSLLEEDKAMN